MVFFYVSHSFLQSFVFKEAAVFDSLCDHGEILIDDPAGTDVQVTDFGISHLAFRKTYVQSAGFQCCSRIFCKDLIQMRLVRCCDSITVCILIDAVPIQDHQHGRAIEFFHNNTSVFCCNLLYHL